MIIRAPYPDASGATRAQTPNDSLGTCLAWADFSDSSTMTISGGTISAIANKGNGSAYSWTQSDPSKQPTYTASGINGRSVSTWTGTQGLFSTAMAFPGAFTFVAVFSTTTISTPTGAIFDSDDRGSHRYSQTLRLVNAVLQTIPFTSAGATVVSSTVNIVANTNYVVRVTRSPYVSTSDGGTIRIFINSTLVATQALSGTASTGTALTSIGQNLASDGGHAGVIGWNSMNDVYDDDSGYRLDSIAADKFVLRGNLDAANPYKSAAPTVPA